MKRALTVITFVSVFIAVGFLPSWDVILPREMQPRLLQVVEPEIVPWMALMWFGSYSLFIIGYRLMFFPECKAEAISLKKEIEQAKKALAKHGIVVKT
mmetsp:Transcript_24970/g.27787  ORF Transcript_24970/g.27787 Transcript_24970/m.27787 type:complete len:98 (-) Transcript_24970:485-778(-)